MGSRIRGEEILLLSQNREARTFAVAAIGRDQVESKAKRKGMTVGEVEKWLGPVLGYEAG